ncbi:MAG: glycosyltransferase [Rickettsiales bacterium]|nr:MAG: glycosyltransferase [Rickettsiales bacterium]
MNSVCMATYNGSLFIEEQILSILKQLSLEDELIISDDSSIDNTVQIITNINDSRVKLLTQNKYQDPIQNFQHALKFSSGKFIFLSDQDDIWVDGKYSEMVNLLDKYDLVISNSKIVDEHLHVLHPSFFKYFNSGKGILKNMIRSSYYGSCMAFKKNVLDVALPFPNTKEIGHDLWIGLVAEIVGTVYFYPKPLLLYRRHSTAFTPVNVGKSSRTMYQMLRGRLVMLKHVITFYIKYKLNWKKG